MLQNPAVPDTQLQSGYNGNTTLAGVPSAVHALELYPIGSRLQKARIPPSDRGQLPSLDTRGNVVKSHEPHSSTRDELIQSDDADSLHSLVIPSYFSSTAQLQARVKAELGRQLFGVLKQRLQGRQRALARSVQVRAEPGEVKLATDPSLREACKDSRAHPPNDMQGGRQPGNARRQESTAKTPPQSHLNNLMGAMPTATQCAWRPEIPIMREAQVPSPRDTLTVAMKGERIRRCEVNGLPMWEVDQTSKIDLVRIHRLKANPDYNRGLFAGLKQFVTRSGLFVVGLTRGTDERRIRPRAWHLFYGSRDTRDTKRTSRRIGADSDTAEVSYRRTMDNFSSSDDHRVSSSYRPNLMSFGDVCRKKIVRGILSEEERAEAASRLKSLREKALETVMMSARRLTEKGEGTRRLTSESSLLSAGVSYSSRPLTMENAPLLPSLQSRYLARTEDSSVNSDTNLFLSEANKDVNLWSLDQEALSLTHTLRPSSRLVYSSLRKNASDYNISNSSLDRTLFMPEQHQNGKGSNSVMFVDPKEEKEVPWSDYKDNSDHPSLLNSTKVSSHKSHERDFSTTLVKTDMASFFTPEEGSMIFPKLKSSFSGSRVGTPESSDHNQNFLLSEPQTPFNESLLLTPKNTDASTLENNMQNIPEETLRKPRPKRIKSHRGKSIQNHVKNDVEKPNDDSWASISHTNLPQAAEHVQLRRAATRILEDLDFESGSFLGLAKFSDFPGDELKHNGSHRQNNILNNIASPKSWDTQGRKEAQELEVHMDQLQDQIETEVEEDLAELIARRNQLKAEVEEQQQLIDTFQMDLHNLSKERWGSEGDAFAIQLTAEVNRYAMEHRQQLQEIFRDLPDDGDISMGGVTDSMLRRFVRGKSDMFSVGTQVTDSDLGYIEDGLRETIEQMDEMFYHEKALKNAIDLTHVALSKIIGFHASLEVESTCRECFFLFEQPRTLWPCGHTFCHLCLTEMYNKNGELVCSECGSACVVGYTPNLSMELIASYQMLQDAKNKSPSGGKTIENTLQGLLNYLVSTRESLATPTSSVTG